MKASALPVLFSAAAAVWTMPAAADWTEVRCDLHAKGSDRLEKMVPCTFGQRQGAVTITLDNGEVYEVPLAAIEGG